LLAWRQQCHLNRGSDPAQIKALNRSDSSFLPNALRTCRSGHPGVYGVGPLENRTREGAVFTGRIGNPRHPAAWLLILSLS
jgi:hypothetical protein